MASEPPVKDVEAAEAPVAVRKEDPPASILQMFSLVTGFELLVLFIGILGTIGHGVAQPITCLLFGDLIDGIGVSAVASYQGALFSQLLSNSTMFGNSTAAISLAALPVADPTQSFMDRVSVLCAKMCYFGIMQVICASMQGAAFKIFSESQVNKMRVLYFDSVLHQDISWFDTRQVAELPLQITDDMEKMAEAFGDKFGSSLMAIWAFVGGYAGAFAMGWQLALVMISILPLLFLGGIIRSRAMRGKVMEIQDWYNRAAAVVEECLYAMRTVVAFGGEKRELEKYSLAVEQARQGGIRNGFKVGAGIGYTSSVIFASYALAFYYGMTLRYNGTINPTTGLEWSPGRIMSVFFCVFIGSFNLGNIDPGVKAFQQGRVSAGRFFAALYGRTEIQCRTEDKREKITEINKFELKDVVFRYPARPDIVVLNGLSLTIQRGQKVAVVGESGSGKSTVMSLLERFYDPISGQVLLNGVDMKNFAVSSVRRCIGYVGQEPVLFATSIRENIRQGNMEATEEQLAQACKDAQLTFVDGLPEGLDTFVGAGGSQFSGGQKQRIAIARALLKQASFLFLDEATSALDNQSEKMIQATIEYISSTRAEGLGIVSIAHRLSTIRGSDLIYVLQRGVLMEQGNHETLMEKKGLYYALAASQESAAAKDSEKEKLTITTKSPEEAGGEDESPTQNKVAKSNKEIQDEQATKEKLREKELAKKYKVPMRRLLSYCKPEWICFVPAVLGAIGEGAAQPVSAVVLVSCMNSFYKPKDDMRHDLQITCLVFVIIGCAQFVATIIEWGAFGILGESMTKRLRVALLTSMFRQEIGFHDDPENAPGMLAKALELYTFRVSTFIKAVGSEAAAISSIGVGLGLAFYYSWQMTLVMLCSIPITVMANALQMVVMMGATRNENDLLKRAQQIISDSVQNSRTVQACGNEKDLVHLYETFVLDSQKGFIKKNILAGISFGLSAGIILFILAGGFVFAAEMVKQGKADFQGVMTAFMGIFFAGMGAGRAAAMMGDFTKAKVACHDMFKMLDRQSKIDGLEPIGISPTEINAGFIEFRDVKFYYPFRPQVQVLKGVNFSITAGQSVGLVGPSGGGKSTVMALIQRFYDPMEGQVLIGTQRECLTNLNIRWWRRQVGFVGQEPVLFNTTVRNNVLYGLDDGEKISEDYLEECKKMAHLDFLDNKESKGWETEVGPRGSRLSGGQKQRVAICRALVRNPALLLLDEATSALDTQSERVVQEALDTARKGRTSFAIAHRLSTISGSDVILVVAEGIILERGSHEELMRLQGVYYKLQMQAGK